MVRGRLLAMSTLAGVLALGALPALPTAAAEAPAAGTPVAAAGEEQAIERLIVRYAPGVRAWTSPDDVTAEEYVDVDL